MPDPACRACREESALTPASAAALWPRLEEAAEKLGLALGSPAAAPCGANCVTRSPFDWCVCHLALSSSQGGGTCSMQITYRDMHACYAGLSWLTATMPCRWDQFFGNCSAARSQGCRVDFMATHFYTCSAQYLQYYLNDVSGRYNRSVWLTEWACPNENGTLARQIRFMRQGLNVLDGDDAVQRCAFSRDVHNIRMHGGCTHLFGGIAVHFPIAC